jgi:formate dehydrogenase beta subunit
LPVVFDELRSIQRQFGYLPAEELSALSKKIHVPVSQIHASASFYPHFRLTPPPAVDVRVCSDMSCHLLGDESIKAALEGAFRGDPSVSVREVSCLGRCDGAPAVSINDVILQGVDASSTVALVRDVLAGRSLPHPHRAATRAPVMADPYGGTGQYGVVKAFVERRNWQDVIAALKASTLRGMGGAGFPTGLKWELVRNTPGQEKYIVCNGDESEPGTIKDRYILENAPHLVVEGMIVAGLVTGARKGIVYIRHEYEMCEEAVREEIERCYQNGWLGPRVMGSDLAFDLSVFVSPGGYICGEESALIEAIEGKRAEPRNKPPFPGTVGLWGKPTAINNVETFFLAAVILARGVEWYKAQGKNGSVGTKFVGISGDVNRPGVFEVPMGTTYAELIDHHAGGVSGGRKLLSFAPSGPSSGYLPADLATLPLDWNAVAAAGSMVGSGAIVVCAEGRCMLDMALNAVRFYRNESCGKCVPCRMGSQKMVEMLKGWTEGRGSQQDLPLLKELSTAMMMGSICGLGQVVPVPIQTVLKHFPTVIEDHLVRRRCPAGVCFRPAAGARVA